MKTKLGKNPQASKVIINNFNRDTFCFKNNFLKSPVIIPLKISAFFASGFIPLF